MDLSIFIRGCFFAKILCGDQQGTRGDAEASEVLNPITSEREVNRVAHPSASSESDNEADNCDDCIEICCGCGDDDMDHGRIDIKDYRGGEGSENRDVDSDGNSINRDVDSDGNSINRDVDSDGNSINRDVDSDGNSINRDVDSEDDGCLNLLELFCYILMQDR